MLWMTILIGGANPPENITLLGTHDFDTGGQIGVSAPPRGSSLPTSAGSSGGRGTGSRSADADRPPAGYAGGSSDVSGSPLKQYAAYVSSPPGCA